MKELNGDYSPVIYSKPSKERLRKLKEHENFVKEQEKLRSLRVRESLKNNTMCYIKKD